MSTTECENQYTHDFQGLSRAQRIAHEVCRFAELANPISGQTDSRDGNCVKNKRELFLAPQQPSHSLLALPFLTRGLKVVAGRNFQKKKLR